MARLRSLISLLVVLGIVTVVVGCGGTAEVDARFVRYEVLQDGTKVARVELLAPGADPDSVQVLTTLDDLERGESVMVEGVGRGWDVPQWMPDKSITRRADD